MIIHTTGHMMVLWIHGIFRGHTVGLGFAYRRSWAVWSLRILGISVETVIEEEPAPGMLIVSNHRSLTDPIIQLAYLDMFIIAKDEVSKIPVIGKGAQMTGIVFVRRDVESSRYLAREATADLLKNGHSVLVYPEGTTTAGRTTAPFKPGTFKVASELGIPVLPVAIAYRDKEDYWTARGMAKQMLQQLGKWRTYARLYIGRPIPSKEGEDFVHEVRQEVDRQLLQLQDNWSPELEG